MASMPLCLIGVGVVVSVADTSEVAGVWGASDVDGVTASFLEYLEPFFEWDFNATFCD